MNDDRRKMLTEYIGECWIEIVASPYRSDGIAENKNRTFTTRDDMMDLYQAIEKAGKWSEYDGEDYAVLRWIDCETARHEKDSDYDAWLFCLDGKDYEPRCKLVSEFYGWEGK